MKKLIVVIFAVFLAVTSFISFAEEKEVRLFQIDHADIDSLFSMAEMLKSDEGQVTVHSSTHNIIVHDYPSYIARIEALIKKLDVPGSQVEIRVIVAEISDTLLEAFGIGPGNISLSPGSFFSLINILSTEKRSSIYTTISVRTLSGEPAAIQVSATEIFAPVVIRNVDKTSVVSFSSSESGDFLEVIPLVKNRESITITVRPLVSTATGHGVTYDRSVFTRVNVKNGETVVLGSFAMDRHDSVRSGVKDITGGRSESGEKRGVVMFLTPTIVE